jgi:alpha-tubulin suppressor-like RCC1 family protein
VRIRTNVAFAPGANIALWANQGPSTSGPLVQTADPWLSDGEVGDIVVVPNAERRDAPLRLRVALGLRGRSAASCADDAGASDCIVARRNLAFIPRQRLRVPITLYAACVGVVCGPDSTCGPSGACVSANVDAAACSSPEGCFLPDEPTTLPPPAVADAGLDASSDVGVVTDGAFVPDLDAADVGPVAPLITQLALGFNHACALFATGRVKCWGLNTSGQLGLGDRTPRGSAPGTMGSTLPFVDFGPNRIPVQLTAGNSHTCARFNTGAVACWGNNNLGQLGRGDTQNWGGAANELVSYLKNIDLGLGASALHIHTGGDFTCAVLRDNTVKCWGDNTDGRLGLGDTKNRGSEPGQMGAALPLLDLVGEQLTVRVSPSHACVIEKSGSLRCWGTNTFGQLGLQDTNSRGDKPVQMGAGLPPVDVNGATNDVMVAAAHTCILRKGDVLCWGRGDQGQLGAGNKDNYGTTPGQMGADLKVVALGTGLSAAQVVGGLNFTCVRFTNGDVKCWGNNAQGMLGLGAAGNRGEEENQMDDQLRAVDLGAGRKATFVAAAAEFACAVLDGTAVKCWGSNQFGQLGIGDTQNRFPRSTLDLRDNRSSRVAASAALA